jgi:hypothetical protein
MFTRSAEVLDGARRYFADLERMLVLQNVNKIERRERIRASVTKQLNANPELKEAYRKLVKNLPAEQQEKAMATIAGRTPSSGWLHRLP